MCIQTRAAAIAEATRLSDLRVARDCTLKTKMKQVRRDVKSVPSALQSRYTRDTQLVTIIKWIHFWINLPYVDTDLNTLKERLDESVVGAKYKSGSAQQQSR